MKNNTINKYISYLAKTNFRNQNKNFGIKADDRLLHTFVIGKTGTGKTTLLKNLIQQDICNGNGLALLDPHGDVSTEIMQSIPDHRKEDVVYINCTNPNISIGYNPLKRVTLEKRALVASGLLEIFEKLFGQKA